MRPILASGPLVAIGLYVMAGPLSSAGLAQPTPAEASKPTISPATPAPPKRRRYGAVAGISPIEPERREANGGPIAIGDNVRGILEPQDRRLRKGRYQDRYVIDLSATDTISIVMQAQTFSPRILIDGPKGFAKPIGYLLPNGFWRVILKPGIAGTYTISATSNEPGTGTYTLSVD